MQQQSRKKLNMHFAACGVISSAGSDREQADQNEHTPQVQRYRCSVDWTLSVGENNVREEEEQAY